MRNVLWVGAGGALGSVARYVAGLVVPSRVPGFPTGTLVVNVVGAFVLGFLAGFFGDRLAEHVRVGLAVGLLGGFTTFSTFALDSVELYRAGDSAQAMANVVVSIVLGLAAAAVGLALGLARTR